MLRQPTKFLLEAGVLVLKPGMPDEIEAKKRPERTPGLTYNTHTLTLKMKMAKVRQCQGQHNLQVEDEDETKELM
jgi:hypothetical protein